MLWTIATTDGFMGLLAALAVALALVSILPVSWIAKISPQIAAFIYLAKPLALAALFSLGLTLGHRIADEHTALVQAAFERDWAQNELTVQRDVAAKAAKLASDAQQHANDLDATVDAYDEYISSLPTGIPACLLDDNDVSRLRNIGQPLKPQGSSPPRLRIPRLTRKAS